MPMSLTVGITGKILMVGEGGASVTWRARV